MCGIAGAIGAIDREITEAVQRMSAALHLGAGDVEDAVVVVRQQQALDHA